LIPEQNKPCFGKIDTAKEGIEVARTFLGIDFGTTQTSVALFYEDGNGDPEIITIGGEGTISTALRLGDSESLYGNDAKEKVDDAPQNTFFNFKQAVGNNTGKKYDTPDGMSYTPEDLALIFLTWLRERIEKGKFNEARLADDRNLYCVIGCPAAWGDDRRHVLVEIANKAGFPRVTACAEPLGVINHHLHKRDGLSGDEPKNVLVYDFGGGTTDVAIGRIEPAGDAAPQITILSTAGISDLGGRNFDEKLAHFFARQQLNQNISVDASCRIPLEIAAQTMKKHLMNRLGDGVDEVTGKAFLSGERQKLLLSKDQFDEVCAPLIQCCEKPVIESLHLANLKESDIAAVILAGGSSLMYYVRDRIKALFPLLPENGLIRSTDPVAVVAKGLALKAFHDVCGFAKSENEQKTQFTFPPRVDLATNEDDKEIDDWWDNLPPVAELLLSPVAAIGRFVNNFVGWNINKRGKNG
jgi:molecular chaperone DnaK (HSP70)